MTKGTKFEHLIDVPDGVRLLHVEGVLTGEKTPDVFIEEEQLFNDVKVAEVIVNAMAEKIMDEIDDVIINGEDSVEDVKGWLISESRKLKRKSNLKL